jgi:hypothetical protein
MYTCQWVGLQMKPTSLAPSLCEASHAPPSAKDENMWPQKGTYTRVAGEVIE